MKPSERIAQIKAELLAEKPSLGFGLFLGGGDEAMTQAILLYLDEQHALANGPECTCPYPTPNAPTPTTCKANSHRSFM